MKVLVVDDVGYSRHSLSRSLDRLGFSVEMAGSGIEALAVLQADHRIEVVVTDLIMGDMDGVGLFLNAQRLERMNDEGTVDLPAFIMLTSARPGRPGSTAKTDSRLKMAESLGFAEVLFKPVDLDCLAKTLGRIKLGTTRRSGNLAESFINIQEAVSAAIEGGDIESAQSTLERLERQVQTLRDLIANSTVQI